MPERMIVVEGPMYSGKTLELLQYAERLAIAGKKVQVFKPLIDDRGEGLGKICSRFGGECEATALKHSWEILENLEKGVDVVIVDEVQFWQEKEEDGSYSVVSVFDHLTESGVMVIFAGLARDFRREPFGPMPDLLARAQEIHTLTAVCDHRNGRGEICGLPATETQRFVDGQPASWDDPIILVGDREEGYAARCIAHHVVGNKPRVDLNAIVRND